MRFPSNNIYSFLKWHLFSFSFATYVLSIAQHIYVHILNIHIVFFFRINAYILFFFIFIRVTSICCRQWQIIICLPIVYHVAFDYFKIFFPLDRSQIKSLDDGFQILFEQRFFFFFFKILLRYFLGNFLVQLFETKNKRFIK